MRYFQLIVIRRFFSINDEFEIILLRTYHNVMEFACPHLEHQYQLHYQEELLQYPESLYPRPNAEELSPRIRESNLIRYLIITDII